MGDPLGSVTGGGGGGSTGNCTTGQLATNGGGSPSQWTDYATAPPPPPYTAQQSHAIIHPGHSSMYNPQSQTTILEPSQILHDPNIKFDSGENICLESKKKN